MSLWPFLNHQWLAGIHNKLSAIPSQLKSHNRFDTYKHMNLLLLSVQVSQLQIVTRLHQLPLTHRFKIKHQVVLKKKQKRFTQMQVFKRVLLLINLLLKLRNLQTKLRILQRKRARFPQAQQNRFLNQANKSKSHFHQLLRNQKNRVWRRKPKNNQNLSQRRTKLSKSKSLFLSQNNSFLIS